MSERRPLGDFYMDGRDDTTEFFNAMLYFLDKDETYSWSAEDFADKMVSDAHLKDEYKEDYANWVKSYYYKTEYCMNRNAKEECK